jgi:hypothetical protein
MSSWKALQNQPSFSADTMLLLTDGSVMVHEFQSNKWHRLTPDGNGSYQNGSWSDLASMADASTIPSSQGGPTYAPTFFASAVFADGRVFVAGGEYNGSSSTAADVLVAEIYDPVFDSWKVIKTPAGWTGIGDAASSVLADGRLLLASFNSSSTAIYDPVTDIWVAGGIGGAKGDSCSEETFTLMRDGNVLTVQCSNGQNAEMYIPSSDKWVPAGTTGNALPQPCAGFVAEIGPAVLLPSDGRVFAVGATGNTALYTPNANPALAGTWANGPTLKDSGGNTMFPMDAPGVLLTNGKVLLAASPGPVCNYPAPTTFFLYDPATNTVSIESDSGNSGNPAFQGRFLQLPNGDVLFSNSGSDIRVYTPDAGGDPTWKPNITDAPLTLVTGHTYKISGTQFNGMSQASTYGDDAQMATNYPVVRLQNSSGQVKYLRTSHHSSMGVATGGTIVSTNIFVPDDTPTGQWNLVVTANGIASNGWVVSVGKQDIFFLVDRSSYGKGEIMALINLSGAPAVIDNALFVVAEGYSRDKIGAAVPTVTCATAGITFVPNGAPVAQDPSLPSNAIQRFTFPFSVRFANSSMFTGSTQNVLVNANFSADGITQPASAVIQLLDTPNPHIQDGDVAGGEDWFLSVDMRVFQLSQGQTRFAATVGSAGGATSVATTFIQKALQNLNTSPGSLASAFDSLPQDEDPSALTLAPTDGGGNAVYNFAIARVRYRDTQVANNVRCFFRMWPAQQTNCTYNTSTTYRTATNGTTRIPLLGIEGDEIVTVPFFASPRVPTSAKLNTQLDPTNVRDIHPDQFGAEVVAFYGCWLDINQPADLRFPPRMVGGNPANIPDGPFTGFGTTVSIQQLVRSQHQCLIAEIAFDPDPIPANTDPSLSDKLAQRNLAFVNVPNPGVDLSRIAPQTFEVRRSPLLLKVDDRPDELMIDWRGLPKDTTATFYMPGTTAAAMLDWASRLYTTHNITQVDPHTLRMTAAGIAFLPVPQGSGANFAGLMSVELPDTVHKGDRYDVVVRQVTSEQFFRRGQGLTNGQTVNQNVTVLQSTFVNRDTQDGKNYFTWRRTFGVFKLTIPVSTKNLLLHSEKRMYAVMQWIGQSIPLTSRWYPVFERYLQQLGGRVQGMGGDPGTIGPSGDGTVPGDGGHGGGGHDGGGGADGGLGGFTGGDLGLGLGKGAHEAVGKVTGLVYDHFGDFEGFLLEVGCDRTRRFSSRERRVECLIREAWRERSTVVVITAAHDAQCPVNIVVGGRKSCDCC